MFHADAANFQAPPCSARKFLVIADFPPASKDGEHHATQLAELLQATGAEVITAASTQPSYAQLPLSYRSRRLFSRTKTTIFKALDSTPHSIIYAGGLGGAIIDKPRWRSRRMEEWRRFRLGYTVARRSSMCTLVFGRSPPLDSWLHLLLLVALLLTKPLGVKVSTLSHPPENLSQVANRRPLKPESKYPLPPPAFPEQFALRANITRLEKTEGHAGLIRDLRQIYDIYQGSKPSGANLFRSLGPTGDTPPTRNARMVRIANQSYGPLGISRFMHHYNLGLTHPFPLSTPSEIATFISWYIHAPVNQGTSPPLPIPADILKNTPSDILKNILELAPRIEDFSHIPHKDRAFFSARIGGGHSHISRMEMIYALRSKLPPTSRKMFQEPWASEEIRSWYQDVICKLAPSMKAFSSAAPVLPAHNPVMTISGITSGESGLARNAKMSAQALHIAGINVSMPNFNIGKLNKTTPLARNVTLHHINADMIPQQVLSAADGIQIGFLLWELEDIPASHDMAGKMLDEIWVPSQYLKSIYETAYDRRVINIGKGILLPTLDDNSMFPLGISGNTYVVLSCFDAHSSVERKNPLATVKAFLEAFAGDSAARMIVKTTPTGLSHWGDPNHQMQQISDLAAKDSRIIIDKRLLPFRDLLAIIARADVVVSSHRAEGFGYIPAYALGYGTPVISTNFSGTTDICTSETAFPVAYDMIPIRPNETIAPMEGSVWADINQSALVEAMKAVRNNPEAAICRAKAGQTLIRQNYSLEMQAKRYYERLNVINVLH